MTKIDMPVPRVYVDSNFLKIERRLKEVFRHKETRVVKFGDTLCQLPLYELAIVDPLDAKQGVAGLEEHRLVDAVMDLALAGRIRLIAGRETYWELLFLPNPGGKFSRLRDGMVERVMPPNVPARVLASAFGPPAEELQRRFFEEIVEPRFVELRSAHPGCKPGLKKQRNHLADVFNLWCAEIGNAEFLVTVDRPFVDWVRQVRRKLRIQVQVVTPSVLLDRISPQT